MLNPDAVSSRCVSAWWMIAAPDQEVAPWKVVWLGEY